MIVHEWFSCLDTGLLFLIFEGMEENEVLNKLVRKYFVVVELVLLLFTVTVLGLLYNHTPGAAFLSVILLSMLAVWYQFKAVTADPHHRLKTRVMYFGFSISCVAVLFALLLWPYHKIMLVAALACMAAGWGIFLWSRQREEQHKDARKATSYLMFLRLVLYTAACLVLLLRGDLV